MRYLGAKSANAESGSDLGSEWGMGTHIINVNRARIMTQKVAAENGKYSRVIEGKRETGE